MKNRNMITYTDTRYLRQQNIINTVCKELGLVAYRPEYHATKCDKNTVIIYTVEGHKYNEEHGVVYVKDEQGRICTFENNDMNGNFDLDYLNGHSVAQFFTDESLRCVIMEKIVESLTAYYQRHETQNEDSDEDYDLGTFSIDVKKQKNGLYDVFFGHEGSSGEHYVDMTPEIIGHYLADDICSVNDEMSKE